MMLPESVRRISLALGACVALATLSSSAFAQVECNTTVPGGPVVGVWTPAGSPYCVEGDITVSLLTIEPGVEVFVDGAFLIDVVTRINANGTEAMPILFSAKSPAEPDNQRWRGIKFQKTGPGSNFTHTIIEYSNESGMTLTDTAAPALDHCVFQNNSKEGNGGAIRATGLLSDLNLVNCTFFENTATVHGGALSVSETGGFTLNIEGSLFDSNTVNPEHATGNRVGGALHLSPGDATIFNSVFTGNRANSRCSSFHCDVKARGGAIFLSAGNVTLVNNEFVDNQADALNQGNCGSGATSKSFGGALYVDSGDVTLVDNILACSVTTATNCHRTLAGAGLYVNGGTVEVTSATIARNSSTGLHRAGGTLEVKNSIVFFNNDNGDQIGGAVTVSYSDVQGGYDGDGNIFFNPAFAGMACEPGDFELLPGSPAIDAADNTALPIDTFDMDTDCDTIERIPTDLNGRPRFADDLLTDDTGVGTAPIVDMGAYEYADCNGNFIGDHVDIEEGTSQDCNGNGIPDACDISLGISDDVNGDGVPNECQGIITIVRNDPPNDAIDARQPHPSDGGDPMGWNELTIVFNGDPGDTTVDDFTLVENGGDGAPPDLVSIEPVCANVVSLQLSEPIEPGAWTTITHVPSGSSTCLGYLPADVNNDEISNANDVLALIDALNGVGETLAEYQTDLDRSGATNASDVLRVIDLLNGAGEFDVFLGAALPE